MINMINSVLLTMKQSDFQIDCVALYIDVVNMSGIPVTNIDIDIESFIFSIPGIDKLTEKQKLELIAKNAATLEFLESPTPEMKRLHQLKWKI